MKNDYFWTRIGLLVANVIIVVLGVYHWNWIVTNVDPWFIALGLFTFLGIGLFMVYFLNQEEDA